MFNTYSVREIDGIYPLAVSDFLCGKKKGFFVNNEKGMYRDLEEE